jgi:hypothetical protein
MDGLARAVGAGVPITFDGIDMVLEPLTLKDFGVIEQYLLKEKRPNILTDAVRAAAAIPDDLPKSERERLSRQLLEVAAHEASKFNRISADEVAAWLDTIEGVIFTVWLLLERRKPGEYSLADVAAKIEALGGDKTQGELSEQQAALRAARDQASGIDTMGNSTGPVSKKTKRRRHRAR